MGSESSSSLRDLFEQALSLPPDERAGFLAAHCPDTELRAAVECLLAADAAEDDAPILRSADVIARAIGETDVAQALPPGSRIGPFELVEVLGEGGSSTVFRAYREIEGVRQEVALKLLRRGLYSADAQRQFRRERQALAQLKHPGIARLIEGGVTESGLAYIALELVEGQPLTDYSREHRLGLRARLLLFQQVCRAVEAAHRALIVHRDLKPSNVLVTEDGQVKLLDFGIAKLLDTDDETQTRLPAFTPAYASPEQRSGGPITTATDVYALGVLCGELMTGQRLSGDTVRTPSSHVKQNTEPGVLPATARATRRQLRGDLDNIVLKAIDTDPDRRYVSAGALADDIECLLDGRPIAAHPPSRSYRARKFISRHRGGVAATAVFLLAILAALGIALWQAREARREAARANAVRDFVEGMFEPIREGVANGKQPSLTELVDQGAARVEQTTTLGAAERVDLLIMFSRLYDFLNDGDRMQVLADQAGAIADADLGADDPRAVDAAVARGIAALRRNDVTHAGQLLEEAERRLIAAHRQDDSWILVEDALAQTSNDRGDRAATLAHERAGLAARIKAYGPASPKTIGGYANLGYALEGAGQFAEAAQMYRHVYAEYVRNGGAQTALSAVTLGTQGAAEMMAGDLVEARRHLRAAMAVFEQLGGKPPSAYVDLAQQHCLVELVTGSASAQAACARAVDLARQTDGTPAADTGRALRLLGISSLQSGDIAAARKALESSLTLLGKDTPPAWRGRSNIALGEVALVGGDAAQAAHELATGVQQLGSGYPAYLHGYGLALLALACHEAHAALDCHADSFEQARQQLEHDTYGWNPLLLGAHIALARIEIADSHADRAASRLQSAIDRASNSVDPAQSYLLDARLWLAVADAQLGRCDRAREGARTAAALARNLAANPHPLLIDADKALSASTQCVPLASVYPASLR